MRVRHVIDLDAAGVAVHAADLGRGADRFLFVALGTATAGCLGTGLLAWDLLTMEVNA